MKLLISTIMVLAMVNSQWSFMADANNSSMVVKGTSTVHDWTSNVGEFTVSGTIEENLVKGLKVLVTTKSIKSGKSIMDDKTYEALSGKAHPQVQFTASSLQIENGLINGDGQLTIAGETRPIKIQAETTSMPQNILKVKGSVLVKMSDFGIEPPTAMFGTLTTGNEVTIEYQLLLNK